ncbi:MAG: FAD-dependent oxidoreductase, partial [Candidatus Brocadiia bacterium]|nr:FAD-dependent oxidoreductase [Candidatus Brocadiia bacterium]
MADEWDVIVIGGGPAGLAAALYTGRAMMRTLVLEKLVVGGQLAEAYDVDNYLGFDEGILGPELVEKMKKHAERFGAKIVSEEASDITADGSLKTVHTSAGEHTAPIVVVASGAYHRKLEVPGEDRLAGAGVSYCATCDG